jgi:amino acid adenylation domain-containing protein
MMVAILATLKGGGTYVPIDPAYPQDRQAFMIEDADVKIVLTRRAAANQLTSQSAKVVCLDEQTESLRLFDSNNLNLEVPRDALLYMIFTSGSTGRPKGSLVYHRGFVNLLTWYTRELEFGSNTTVLVFSSLSFDLTQKNLFSTLVTGGKLVLLESVYYDAERILNLIQQHGVTLVNCTPSAFYGLLSNTSESSLRRLEPLRFVVLGGESISTSRMRSWIESPFFHAEFVNSYGPTECTDVVAFFRVKEPKNYGSPIPIGKAVPNTHLYVLDDSLRIVPDGAPGELCIGGICVGAGYVNRAELNEQKFVQLALRGDPNERFYRTGDRVRYLSDGNIDFLGRVDHQVKLRGYRIELGEIQNALERCEEVRESYVMAHKDERGEQALVAYIVLNNPSQENAITSIRKRLLESLPEYMVPSTFIPLDAMPLTPNGKVDRARLPTPGTKSKEKRPRKLQKPSGQGSRERAESLILQRWSELLQLDEVSTTDRFFDIGGTSLKAIQFVGALGQELDISIPMVALFQSPTIAEFVQYIKTNFASKFVDKFGSDDASSVGNSTAQNEVTSRHERSVECDIAIIGMSARVPGAKNVEEFWNMLRDGVEGVRFLSDDELLSAGVDPKLIADPTYVKAVAAMDDVEGFDAEFFGMLKREVELMDPQHRAILEGAYVALEHAGYINLANRLRVGVFAGVARDAYFTSNLLAHPIFRNLAGDYSLMIGNEKDFPATRVAYRLNLKGPAVNVQTACSSSGVAIQLASQNLVLGECDVALAGGCRVLVPLTGYQYVEGGTLSPDGHVRAFDAKGRGMIRGSGVCFVVLKRLDRALEDGDSIYGVIRAVSVNNDGSAKVGFAAPSVQGQSSVIQSALLKSGVNPESIGYVETHGTATAIGDPIEMAALTDAFSRSTNKKAFCAIGSVKTNIGHLDAGSCVAGLIKTVLAIKNGQIPPSLNYETPNPQIDFPNTPFFVNTALRSWQTNGEPRRAGVSSFGLGGTNVHVIVEEHHAQPTQPGKGCEVFVLSAKTTTALESLSANLAKFLSDDSSINLADVAFTLQEGRQQFDCRRAIVARDFNEAIAEIKSQENRIEGTAFAKKPSVVFMFSGQGSQHVNMARDLYEKEPTFQAFFDEACDAFLPHLGLDLRTIIYPKVGEEGEATSRINQTQFAQPSLFVVGYALANYLIELGIEPDCMIGHSVGEYAAACISGVFALEDVAKILSARARLMQSQPRGSMRAVRLPEAELLPLLKDGVSLAASNSPMLSVVSGTDEAIALFDAELAARGLATTVLHTSHAFHSEMMDPICAPFAEVVRAVKAAPATIPILSTATVEWLTEKEATATDYWVSQLRLPVRFSSVVTELAKSDNRVFIECGPNTALTNAVKAHLSKENSRRVINCLPHVNEPRLSRIVFHSAIGRLWTLGGTPDWSKVRGDGKRRRVGLPSYPFERRRFWVDNQNAESELSNPRKCEPRGEPNISSVETERSTLSSGTLVNSNNSFAARIVNQQLELMSRQLGLLMNARERVRVTTSDTSERNRNVNVESIQSQTKDVADVASPVAAVKPETTLDNTNAASSCGSTFVGPQSRITKTSNTNLSTCQRAYLDKLIALYNRQTRESKAFAEKHRNHLADPRVVSGFKPIIKELVYPIVVNKSLGARLWDIDGNEYVDMLNGFGSNFFGHRAPFVIEALEKQFREGIEIGPQHPLAGELAEEITEFLGHDRVAFCNTGSEAVLGAMRIARASTGRDVIAMFAGSYHGIFDEVIVRGTKSLRSLPAAPGIQPGAVANILVLDYATDESLRILKERAGTLAAILVEPVQSRKPDLQPRQFLHELRRLTRESNTCLIFDEVVTGFRAGKTGAQGFFGLKADVATYGKVLGGGMNIGVIAGDRRYMDALDGGAWHFGDQSVPEVGVTYFAGTFVRHPPALVAARAVINYLKQKDASFYESINARTARFVDTVNAHAKRIKAPLKLAHFASVVRVEWTREFALSELLFVHLRQKGVHIWDHRPVYLTAAHSDDDIAFVAKAFVESLDEMKQGEILPES